MGEPFIVKGTDDVPVQISYTAVFEAMHYDLWDAASPNKLFVLEFQMKNIGIRTTTVFSSLSKWDVLVDKGYIYESEFNFNLTANVDPEEVVTNDVVFKILASTTPTAVRYYDTCLGSTAGCSVTYRVDLTGVNIPAKEELTIGSAFCIFYNGTANLLNVTNSGLAVVTVADVYYANQLVSSNPTTIQPEETVSIPINIPASIQPGFAKQYQIKVVTTAGNTFTTNCYYEAS